MSAFRLAVKSRKVKNGRDDEDGEAAQFPAQFLRGGDELPEAMRVVPDAAADGDEADADPDIGEDIDRALHRIRDREVGVFTLIEIPDEENAAGETDALHEDLDGGEVPDDEGALEGAAHHRHGVFVQQGRGSGAKEAHQKISQQIGARPGELSVPDAMRATFCGGIIGGIFTGRRAFEKQNHGRRHNRYGFRGELYGMLGKSPSFP